MQKSRDHPISTPLVTGLLNATRQLARTLPARGVAPCATFILLQESSSH
jgi:hypothetical protein